MPRKKVYGLIPKNPPKKAGKKSKKGKKGKKGCGTVYAIKYGSQP